MLFVQVLNEQNINNCSQAENYNVMSNQSNFLSIIG